MIFVRLLPYTFAIVIIVRLVDGSSYNEGRVEVYYNGRWGTVCNDGWNDNYASLVCAQLGFGSSGKLADFGPGTGTILLENVICSINDTILASCGHYGVGITVGCNHNNDVGVKCDGMYLTYYNINIRSIYSTLFEGIMSSQYGFKSMINQEFTTTFQM